MNAFAVFEADGEWLLHFHDEITVAQLEQLVQTLPIDILSVEGVVIGTLREPEAPAPSSDDINNALFAIPVVIPVYPGITEAEVNGE